MREKNKNLKNKSKYKQGAKIRITDRVVRALYLNDGTMCGYFQEGDIGELTKSHHPKYKWAIFFSDKENKFSNNYTEEDLDKFVEVIKDEDDEIRVHYEINGVSFPSVAGDYNTIHMDAHRDKIKLDSEYDIDEIPNLIKALQKLYDEVKK